MDVEGVGCTAPKPVTYTFDRNTLRILLVEARKRQQFRGYGGRGRGQWDDGMVGTFTIDGVGSPTAAEAPVLAGFLGEYSTMKCLNGRLHIESNVLDTVLRPKGDGGIDFEIFGLTGQVKCRTKPGKTSLVRVKDDRGRDTFPTAEVLVFCEWRRHLSVDVVGWCLTQSLYQYYERPALRGNHINREVPDCDLKPMCALVSKINARRLAE